jgi:hypothetical protein
VVDPKLVEAKLESDKTAREARLWREVNAEGSWVAHSWPSAILFVGAIALLALSDIPRDLYPVLTAILLLNVAIQTINHRRVSALVELFRMKSAR